MLAPGGATVNSQLVGNLLLWPARHPQPDQLAISLIDPEHPVKGLLKPSDSVCRRPDAHGLRFHGCDLSRRSGKIRPRVEVAAHCRRWEFTQGAGGFSSRPVCGVDYSAGLATTPSFHFIQMEGCISSGLRNVRTEKIGALGSASLANHSGSGLEASMLPAQTPQ